MFLSVQLLIHIQESSPLSKKNMKQDSNTNWKNSKYVTEVQTLMKLP